MVHTVEKKSEGKEGRGNVTILEPLNILRTETVLSRFPVHNLAKKGKIHIHITQKNKDGELDIKWKVSPNSTYGAPRALAYRIDRLIVNRRIDEFERPVPAIIPLGTLHDIAKELRLGGGTNAVKKALRQNASAFIEAKFTYTNKYGKQEWFEAEDTRYGLYTRGMKLPNGTKAEVVYIVLHDAFWRVINNANTRPLDYDYFALLKPASARWYELASYKFFGAIKYRKPQAKMLYSEFCAAAPQKRHHDYDSVKKQMQKVHQQHIKADYIRTVTFERTVDSDGNPDWLMCYDYGDKARTDYEKFAKKRIGTGQASSQGTGRKKESTPETSTQEQPHALVLHFYKRFHRVENVKPTAKALTQATTLIEKYGFEKAQFVLDFAYGSAQETKFKIEHFGGVISYAPRAIAMYESQRKREAQRQAKEREERRKQQYEEYQKDEINRIKGMLPPEELAQIEKDSRQELIDEGTFPQYLDLSAKIKVDGRLAEQYNLPDFETWCQQKERA